MRRPQVAMKRPLACPEELSIHEKYQWTQLMKRAPAGHFLEIDTPALILYCQLESLRTRLYPSVRDGTATASQREEFLSLSARVQSMHRGLRIGPSTRNAQRDGASRRARESADAFDPTNNWREAMNHGQAGKA